MSALAWNKLVFWFSPLINERSLCVSVGTAGWLKLSQRWNMQPQASGNVWRHQSLRAIKGLLALIPKTTGYIPGDLQLWGGSGRAAAIYGCFRGLSPKTPPPFHFSISLLCCSTRLQMSSPPPWEVASEVWGQVPGLSGFSVEAEQHRGTDRVQALTCGPEREFNSTTKPHVMTRQHVEASEFKKSTWRTLHEDLQKQLRLKLN